MKFRFKIKIELEDAWRIDWLYELIVYYYEYDHSSISVDQKVEHKKYNELIKDKRTLEHRITRAVRTVFNLFLAVAKWCEIH